MKSISIPFGKEVQHIELPEDHLLYDLHGNMASIVTNEKEAILRALRQPIDSKPLRDIVREDDTVAIVVSDITRLVHTEAMLPVIVSELNEAGVRDDQITIIVAQGTHRAHTPEEDVIVCGTEMARRLRIVQHDCRDKENLTYVGTTRFGNDVYINAEALQADKLILTGAVSFHPMAGYGGGRKAILPGIAGFDSIMTNHSLALAETQGDGCNPHCDTASLEENPFHQDMLEAAQMVHPDFLVNTVFTADGDLCDVVGGHWRKAWEKGCQDVLATGGVPIEEQADVTIASAGGYPKDLNLYQGCKAYMNAVFATKPGGVLILVLDCPDIKEPEIFTKWFFRSDLDQVEQELRREFLMPGFVAFKTRCIIASMKTCYVVTRPENFDIIRQTGQIPAPDVETAWKMAQQEVPEHYTVTIMGHAAATFPVYTK
ncbi:nickel-dependent lactate racemase [Megasphaera paucivorans]|uniref:Nickel-dependent lactate racemase n=1 Tax=Megasphaera paucivorans TaxID=349095 RepID=A0A1G9VYZ4_9FIRM|nr:nickel-dependent lactate racemase [Megasphaera paucivorans]SDM77509.1 Nickel-dependent lactate racemase [Megasphaera paucivorans]